MNHTIALWIENVKDKDLLEELYSLSENERRERFFNDLTFGTGGLRGIIGVGTNCMNIYTVARASRGIAAYMKQHKMCKAAISYDSRKFSRLFAQTAARVFASHNIDVLIVKELMPTPFLSFLTREEHCDVGIMITASHNPAQYNGYKVYDASGCQITDKTAADISDFISQADYFAEKDEPDFDILLASGKIRYCNDAVEEKYLDGIRKTVDAGTCNVHVTYTALNGTGYRLLPKLLDSAGITVDLVQEQCVPDESFTTCTYPNPERAEALELGIRYAKKNNSDVLIATDPDADRVGIAVRHEGKYVRLTGNEVGLLLAEYLLGNLKKKGVDTHRYILVKTIVTTNLAEKIAERYGAGVINVLTGFKYIGEQICRLESIGEEDRFLLGFEESYGYLLGTQVRDKDALVASLAICKMIAEYKAAGKDLVEALRDIYNNYGCLVSKLLTYEFKGSKGIENIKHLMAALRNQGNDCLLSKKVIKFVDYKNQNTGLPKAEVLSYDLADDVSIIIRPSGTEPLLKIYLMATSEATIDILQKQIDELIEDYR